MIGSFLRLVTVLAAFAVVLSAAMLYRVKTETRELKADIRSLDREGDKIRERIQALETEWAYLEFARLSVRIGTPPIRLAEFGRTSSR